MIFLLWSFKYMQLQDIIIIYYVYYKAIISKKSEEVLYS